MNCRMFHKVVLSITTELSLLFLAELIEEVIVEVNDNLYFYIDFILTSKVDYLIASERYHIYVYCLALFVNLFDFYYIFTNFEFHLIK